MTPDEIERAAMQGARANRPDPPGDLLDAFLYMALYSLYAMLYAGQITREQAKPVKTRAVAQYNRQLSQAELWRKREKAILALWHRIGSDCNAYARERTLDNADRLWASIHNLPEGSKPKTHGTDEV